MTDSLKAVREDVIACARCPRLVSWRNETAREPPTRYAGQEYWAKPLPGFGDPNARLIVVGLAPPAHGGNRTGRIFTPDRSGDWLFPSLPRAGYATQPRSVARDDGRTLKESYASPHVRCPPAP